MDATASIVNAVKQTVVAELNEALQTAKIPGIDAKIDEILKKIDFLDKRLSLLCDRKNCALQQHELEHDGVSPYWDSWDSSRYAVKHLKYSDA